jgi:DNA modification methylase
VTLRKPGVNVEPIGGHLKGYVGMDAPRTEGDEYRDSINIWQQYASPVWMDINRGKTLQKESAREEEDERHVCPLQLQVIERAIALWTNPGDVVLDPFLGIGSTVYQALKMGRKGIGTELKQSYFQQAVLNCANAIVESGQLDMFSEELAAVGA